jgi:hypothetical protein
MKPASPQPHILPVLFGSSVQVPLQHWFADVQGRPCGLHVQTVTGSFSKAHIPVQQSDAFSQD